jgi:hypothetical protein
MVQKAGDLGLRVGVGLGQRFELVLGHTRKLVRLVERVLGDELP